jgi:hypothetical protein
MIWLSVNAICSIQLTDNLIPRKGTAVSDIDRFRVSICSRRISGSRYLGAYRKVGGVIGVTGASNEASVES